MMTFRYPDTQIPSQARRGVFTLLTALMLLMSHLSFAQGLDSLLQPDDDFLPEAKAYVVTPELKENKVSFTWRIADGYYLYRHQFGLKLKSEHGVETLRFNVPDGIIKFDKIFQKDFEVYYATATLSADIGSLPEKFEFVLHSQGCADAGLCYPPRTQYFSLVNDVLSETEGPALTLENEASAPSANLDANAVEPIAPSASEQSLFLVLLGAIIGGMILNLMPCVFPVLSLKALTLATGNQAEHRANGWAYTAGVVISFAIVAGILIAAKSVGTELGWGFQLQQPIFIAGLVYLFFLLAMNLFGLFEIGTRFMGVGQNLTQGSGLNASFFTGVLAAVVASPCTAPFMATAIGFTLTQGALITLLVFIALGFGMALPMLLLSYSHNLASKLPSPGPWMETFKQFLAFPLLFTAVWLLMVLGNQTSAYASALIVGGMTALGMAFWLFKKEPSGNAKWLVRAFAGFLIVAALTIAFQVERYTEKDYEQWQPYSQDTLSALRNDGQAVFIDLTADWCITCKVNERVALNIDSVMNFAQDNNIAMLRGDWTKSDPEITALLRQYGRNGVPLYLMYPANAQGDAEILPQILSPGAVLEAMQNAISGKAE